MCGKGCDIPPSSALLPPACSCPPSPLPALCQQLKLPWCQQTIETYLGVWQSPASSTLGQRCARAGQCCQGFPAPAAALQHCRDARARLPFPSRLLQAAVSHAGGMRVPSMLPVPVMPWAHGCGSCTSQPAKLSVRNAMCTNATWVPCPAHVQVPWCSCMLSVDCIVCVHCPSIASCTGHTLHVCVWVKIACCAHPLCALPTGCMFVLARVLQTSLHVLRELQANMRSLCGLQVMGARDTLQRCAGGMARVHASHTLADGLDLPNASRTNKTFRSGLARGARRQASAELLRARTAWAGWVLCHGLPAAPSPSFLPSRVPPGWEPVSLLRPLL